MTHDIIKTKDYLLIVDNSGIKEGDWYPLYCEICNKINSVDRWDGKTQLMAKNIQLKIIAHLPLNGSPILEGVDLLPEIEDTVMPAGFECEINNPMFALSLQPQITTNSQGLTQWVGKYIY